MSCYFHMWKNRPHAVVLCSSEPSLCRKRFRASSSRKMRREQKKRNDGGGGETRKRLPANPTILKNCVRKRTQLLIGAVWRYFIFLFVLFENIFERSECARTSVEREKENIFFFPHPYPLALAVNKSPAVYISSPSLDGLWRENTRGVLHGIAVPFISALLSNTVQYNVQHEQQY